MLVDGLPTPNAIIVATSSRSTSELGVDANSRGFLVPRIVYVNFVKAYTSTNDLDACGRTFEFPFLTKVCALSLY
jgi:hypothetical protein